MRRLIFFTLVAVASVVVGGSAAIDGDTTALAQGTGQDRLTVFETFGREQ